MQFFFLYFKFSKPLQRSKPAAFDLNLATLSSHLDTVTCFDKTEIHVTINIMILKVGVMYVNKSWIQPKMHGEKTLGPLQLHNNYINIMHIDFFTSQTVKAQ